MWWGKGVISRTCEAECDLHVETIRDVSNVFKNDDTIQMIRKMGNLISTYFVQDVEVECEQKR